MSSADPSAPAAASAVIPSASDRLEVGACWQGRYRIEREQRGGDVVTYFARRASDESPAILRKVTPSTETPARREAARRLGEVRSPEVLELIETVAQPDGRVEAWRGPSGPSVQEWLSQRDLPPEHVLPLAQAAARALLALHERGLVLLQLSSATVFFEGDRIDAVRVGALEQSVPLGGEGVVSVPVDPLLVPPEGLNVTHLPPNDDLKAWDWWTLGRFVQELVLGKPIAVHLLDRELPRDSADVRLEAEALLNETQPHGSRAGAVESMPDMPPEVRALLRGVLTAPRAARWGDAEVSAWLEGKAPADRYDLPRGSVLLMLGEERLTLAEIALRFGEESHWNEGVAQFTAPEPPAGSAVEALLSSGAGYEAEREWYLKVCEIREAASFRGFVPAARNEVLAAVAWLGVAPAGTRLRWRGRPVDLDLLRDLAKDAGGLDRMRVLCSRTFIDLLQQRDNATARSMRTWGHDWEEAFALAEKHRWAASAAMRCKLAAHVFADTEAKAAALKQGRETFHQTSSAPLQALFGAEHLTSGQLGLVAYTLERPQAFGYISHGDWWQSEQKRLRSRGQALLQALRNLQSAAAVRAGLPAFCRALNWWMLQALLLVSTVLLWPGIAGALSALVVVGVSWFVRRQAGGVLRSLVPPVEEEPWRWAGVADRLQIEATRVSGSSGRARPTALRQELAQVNQELVKLPISPAPEPVASSTAMLPLWLGAIGSWILVVALVGITGWQAVSTGWRPSSVVERWVADVERVRAHFSDVDIPPPPAPADAKPAWPYVSSGVIHPLNVVARTESSERQRIIMKSFHLSLQEHYDAKTLVGLVAAPVPVDDATVHGLMIIDIASGQLVTGTVYHVAQPPVHQMSVDIDGTRALYLDGP